MFAAAYREGDLMQKGGKFLVHKKVLKFFKKSFKKALQEQKRLYVCSRKYGDVKIEKFTQILMTINTENNFKFFFKKYCEE